MGHLVWGLSGAVTREIRIYYVVKSRFTGVVDFVMMLGVSRLQAMAFLKGHRVKNFVVRVWGLQLVGTCDSGVGARGTLSLLKGLEAE